MLTFNEYIQEAAASAKPLEPIAVMTAVVRQWFAKHRARIVKSVKRESEARHANQIRVHCDVGGRDPWTEMNNLNKAIVRNLKLAAIGGSDNVGSKDYETWSIALPGKAALEKDFSAYTAWKKILSDLYGPIGWQVQMDSLFSAPAQFDLVYTIPTKGRKKDAERSILKPKDFVPQDFGLECSTGKHYTLDELLDVVAGKINSETGVMSSQYSKYRLFSKYFAEALKQITGKDAGIDVKNSIPLAKIASRDIDIINKNFGEILCAAYILANTKGSSSPTVSFPNGSNEPVVDFYIHPDNTLSYSYSVKNKRGSKGTAMSSIGQMIDKYLSSNPLSMPMGFVFFESIMKILSATSSKDSRVQDKLVAGAIEMTKRNPQGKCAKVIEMLDKAVQSIKSIAIPNVSQSGYKAVKSAIDAVSKMAEGNPDRKAFVKAMEAMTKECTAIKNPSDIDKLVSDRKYGVAVYPVGKALTNDLNADAQMLHCLNAVLNCVANVAQIKTNAFISPKGKVYASCTEPKPFKTANFRFDYNGYRDNIGNNRSIGFKMAD